MFWQYVCGKLSYVVFALCVKNTPCHYYWIASRLEWLIDDALTGEVRGAQVDFP